jgi:hypothetical protein
MHAHAYVTAHGTAHRREAEMSVLEKIPQAAHTRRQHPIEGCVVNVQRTDKFTREILTSSTKRDASNIIANAGVTEDGIALLIEQTIFVKQLQGVTNARFTASIMRVIPRLNTAMSVGSTTVFVNVTAAGTAQERMQLTFVI